MVEKKMVVDGLTYSYSGAFDLIEFYKAVEDWIRANGFEKELKKKLEHVAADGRDIEWHTEIWRKVTDFARHNIVMRVLMKKVNDVQITKGRKKRRLDHGDVLITLDAFLETDYEKRWQQKPFYTFLTTLFDKYIYKYQMGRYEAPLSSATYSLRNKIIAFFDAYKQ